MHIKKTTQQRYTNNNNANNSKIFAQCYGSRSFCLSVSLFAEIAEARISVYPEFCIETFFYHMRLQYIQPSFGFFFSLSSSSSFFSTLYLYLCFHVSSLTLTQQSPFSVSLSFFPLFLSRPTSTTRFIPFCCIYLCYIFFRTIHLFGFGYFFFAPYNALLFTHISHEFFSSQSYFQPIAIRSTEQNDSPFQFFSSYFSRMHCFCEW